MLGLLALLWALQMPGSQVVLALEQPPIVLGLSGSSASIPCIFHSKYNYIHWYRHQEDNPPERLLKLGMSKMDVHLDSVLKADKVSAVKDKDDFGSYLLVLRLERSDEGMYYCAAWAQHSPRHCSNPRAKSTRIPH